MNKFDKLRDTLEALGWRISDDPMRKPDNLIPWYAWLADRPDEWPDCECNDKPPSLCVHPYHYEISEHSLRGVNISLIAQAGGRWFDLKMYSVPIDEALQASEDAIHALGAAWKGVVAEMKPEVS